MLSASQEPDPLQELAGYVLLLSIFSYAGTGLANLNGTGQGVVAPLLFYIQVLRGPVFFLACGMAAARTLARSDKESFLNGPVSRQLLALALGCTLLFAFRLGWMTAAGAVQPRLDFSIEHLWLLDYMLFLNLGAALIWKLPVLQSAGARLAGVAVRRGGLLVLALPMSLLLYFRTGWEGLVVQRSSLVPDPVPFLIYGWFFVVGLASGAKQAVLDSLLFRWRIRLVLTMLFTLLLYSAHHRFGSAPQTTELLASPRRALFCLSYAFLSLRGSIALAGMSFARLSFPSAARSYVADSCWWIYLIHVPVLLLAQTVIATVPIPGWLQYLVVVVTTFLFSFASYEVVIRATPFRKWFGVTLHRESPF